jgi:hypothetical protein
MADLGAAILSACSPWPAAAPVIICPVLTGKSGAYARPQQREKGRMLVNEQHAPSEFYDPRRNLSTSGGLLAIRLARHFGNYNAAATSELAQSLGWKTEQIRVLDRDLGQSDCR